MLKRINDALKWRINFISLQYLKFIWKIRQLFDFSENAAIDTISVVVVGRNDNYGGDFTSRLKATLDWNLSHLPNPELIYIEWNQIQDRPSDCEWIAKRYPNAKCYIVPNEIHRAIARNHDKMPVMEYFGKNLGIRQATKDYVLMINADSFIGNDVIKAVRHLNKNSIYGTHYISFKWDGEPLNNGHQKNKRLIVTSFPAAPNLGSVVGNFILTHKTNWLKATGYDEKLNNVRAGVDTNGLQQLLSLGLKPMVLGHHYHLDHPESIIHGGNDSHGKHSFNNIQYKNPDDWGLTKYPLKQISERVWQLQPI